MDKDEAAVFKDKNEEENVAEKSQHSGEAPGPTSEVGKLQVIPLVSLALTHGFNDAYVAFLAPLLPMLISKLGLSLTLAGLLVSVLSVSTSLAQPIFGYVIDRTQWVSFLMIAPAVTGLSLSLLGLANSYAMIIVLLVGGGLSTAIFHPQAMSVVPSIGGRRRGTAMSVFNAGGALGYSLGPLFILSIVEAWGLRSSYWAAVPGVLLSLLLFRVVSFSGNKKREGATRKSRHGRGKKPEHVETTSGGLGEIFAGLDRRWFLMGQLWLILMLRATVSSSFVNFLPVILEQKAWSSLAVGVALFIFTGSGALGGFVGGYLSDQFNRRIVILGALVIALPVLWFLLRVEGWPFFLLLALAGASLNSVIPVALVFAQEIIPENVATVSGIMSGGGFGVGGVLVSAVGWLADRIGLALALDWTMGLLVVAVAVTFALPQDSPVDSKVQREM